MLESGLGFFHKDTSKWYTLEDYKELQAEYFDLFILLELIEMHVTPLTLDDFLNKPVRMMTYIKLGLALKAEMRTKYAEKKP